MTFSADSAERLIAPPAPTASPERARFAVILLICLLAHAALLALLLRENESDAPAVEQEIPVEVVVEPPPEDKAEPAPQPPPPKQQAPQEKYVKPAFDAPRAQNKETTEREAPDQETAAPNLAPPKEHAEPEATPQKEATPVQETPEPAPQAAKQAEEAPEAEIVEPAEPTPQAEPEKDQAKSKTKVPPKPTTAAQIADQIAALAPLPDFKLGSASKQSPVSGGNARTTYLSILYGLIVPRMQIPRSVRALRIAGDGIVEFYLDERGNLIHQAVVRGSGSPDLDAAAISALRRAAPFPAPPLGHPRSIQFHYYSR
jgi:TonB family protein